MDEDVTSLGDHLAVLRRRWIVVATFLVLGALAGYGLSLTQATMYEATTRMLVTVPVDNPDGATAAELTPEEVATQAEVIRSDNIARRVIETLNLPESPETLLKATTVSTDSSTSVVEIQTEQPTAQGAADVANTFSAEYIGYNADRVQRSLEAKQASYKGRLGELRDQLKDLRKAQASLTDVDDVSEAKTSIRILTSRQARVQAQLLQAKFPVATPPASDQILQTATPAPAPSQPRPARATALGALLGLLLGVMVAYARDRRPDKRGSSTRTAEPEPVRRGGARVAS
jgi:polysaccharide biosynthesis transport protein